MPSLQKTKDQERAAKAWGCVSTVKSQAYQKEYKSLAQKMPSYILTNGLGQTLAFLKAKGKGNRADEHEVLYGHLSAWVMSQVDGRESDRLLNWVMESESGAYRRATAETLAFLNWLKRFAEAELG
ncbi:MAG TPA: type III-B CRISPR module-associated protein Cmr5 [Alphaproteobacteria bacterium]|nr:type III-B CRISPR module-associated protein Cmr5 [Alphaproteobacteria bacterium]